MTPSQFGILGVFFACFAALRETALLECTLISDPYKLYRLDSTGCGFYIELLLIRCYLPAMLIFHLREW